VRPRVGLERSFIGMALLMSLSAGACARQGTVPDPKDAAEAYASAAEKGDADAIWSMLSTRSRATTSKNEVDQSVKGSRAELADQAKDIRKNDGTITAVARLRYEDGSEAALVLEDGKFSVASAGMLPGGGSTAQEALSALRDVLKRRSYPALLRLLSPELRAQVEAQLRGLVEALDDPSAIAIPPGSGDDVEIKLSNGHRVRLRREQGTWYVENFE
jgi:hypothetical protein